MKFLKSLPSEWKTHTLIWRNKANLEEQSLDDLFNNLKIHEAEVKGSSTSIQNIQNIAFMSSNNIDSTNESVNAAPSVSAASPKAKVSTPLNVDSFSDVVIYSFFTSQSNSPQIHEAEVKGSSTSIQNIQNIAFVSSNNIDNTNESVNAAPSVSAASPKAKVSTPLNVDSFSDVVIYSFFASQSNSPQILEVIVDEVIKRYDAMTTRVRLFQERIRAPLNSFMILSLARGLDQLIV
nr:hypothetical protein [Tanacetum cinerariifolium]